MQGLGLIRLPSNWWEFTPIPCRPGCTEETVSGITAYRGIPRGTCGGRWRIRGRLEVGVPFVDSPLADVKSIVRGLTVAGLKPAQGWRAFQVKRSRVLDEEPAERRFR